MKLNLKMMMCALCGKRVPVRFARIKGELVAVCGCWDAQRPASVPARCSQMAFVLD